jgi:hypothetical protein
MTCVGVYGMTGLVLLSNMQNLKQAQKQNRMISVVTSPHVESYQNESMNFNVGRLNGSKYAQFTSTPLHFAAHPNQTNVDRFLALCQQRYGNSREFHQNDIGGSIFDLEFFVASKTQFLVIDQQAGDLIVYKSNVIHFVVTFVDYVKYSTNFVCEYQTYIYV